MKNRSCPRITKELFKERGYVCEYCGASDETIVGHHAFARSLKPEWKYEKFNIILLCFNCHTGKNGVENGNKKIDAACKYLASTRRKGNNIIDYKAVL